jgi:hypothetical protein
MARRVRPKPVGTPVRWERAVHREGRAAVLFCIHRQVDLFLDLFFLITKLLRCYCLGGGAMAISVIACSFLTPEERRHTVKLGMSIGVPCRHYEGCVPRRDKRGRSRETVSATQMGNPPESVSGWTRHIVFKHRRGWGCWSESRTRRGTEAQTWRWPELSHE